MKNKKVKIFNFLIFLFLLIITFYIVFKNNNINDIINNIKSVNCLYILLGFFCMFIFVTCEALNIKHILSSLNYKIPFLKNIKYALVGFFFSSITPSSSGGQPLQIYFMSKDKIKMTHSLLTLLVEVFCFQLASCFLAIIGFFINYNLLIKSIGKIKYLMFLGLSLNLIVITFLIIIIFSKKIALKLSKFVFKILSFFHYKKADKFYEKTLNQIEEYHNCALYLKEHKKIFYKTFLICLIQLSFYHSIPYFVYLSFGLNEFNIFTFIFIQAVLYVSVSCLPFPGAMGVSEGSFMILFKMFFPATIISSAMLLSRAISFYIFVIITGLLILLFVILEKHIFIRKLK